MAQNILEKFNEQQIARLAQEDKKSFNFAPGDTVKVNVRITEGKTERLQAFEGLCISIKRRGLNSAFTVRKISHGEGVERTFPLYSPVVESVTTLRKGVVRRAKLYYMRELSGKSARITEKKQYVENVASKAAAAKNIVAEDNSAA